VFFNLVRLVCSASADRAWPGFIARGWHIRSNGTFAATCVGVVLLVMSLEALRRLAKEYDAYIVKQRIAALDAAENNSSSSTVAGTAAGSSDNDDDDNVNKPTNTTSTLLATGHTATRRFTPTLPQQLIRATFHLLQFAVAYFVMLLAMYYNGYIIICILIGAFFGSFIFGWESIALP
jgi:copper transporter 1